MPTMSQIVSDIKKSIEVADPATDISERLIAWGVFRLRLHPLMVWAEQQHDILALLPIIASLNNHYDKAFGISADPINTDYHRSEMLSAFQEIATRAERSPDWSWDGTYE